MSHPPETRLSLLRRMAEVSPERDEYWAEFYVTYGEDMRGWCRRQHLNSEDAEDVIQDVLRKLLTGVRSYKPEEGKFRVFLATIVNNAVRDFLRRMHRLRGRGGDSDDLLTTQPDQQSLTTSLDGMIEEEIRQLVFERVANRVGPTHFKMFCRRRIDKVPAAVVAEEFGIPIEQVYQTVYCVGLLVKKEIDRLNDCGPH